MPDGVAAVEAQVQRVVLGAQLGAADVAQRAPAMPFGAALEHESLELRAARSAGPRRATLIWNVCPVGAGGWPTWPGGDDGVLLAQRRHHVRGGQPARRQPHRIQPQPHGVLALAEDAHVGRRRGCA